VIQAGRISTGHRVWILHSEVNLLSGYFHLSDLNVTVGDIVIAGTPLGLVGHNPVDRDPVHLHFELYSGELSAYPQGTLDPAPYLANSKVEDATNGR
jgi:murein DD-endopeptidase MepM/ murein hydrolase activator NlpD